jgi:Protein of unknown function (DUF2917)
MSSSVYYLPAGQALTLPNSPKRVLHVLSGRVWVTASGDLNDYFVQGGESLKINAHSAVIEAIYPNAATYAIERL